MDLITGMTTEAVHTVGVIPLKTLLYMYNFPIVDDWTAGTNRRVVVFMKKKRVEMNWTQIAEVGIVLPLVCLCSNMTLVSF